MATLILMHRVWERQPIVAVAVRDEDSERPAGYPREIVPGALAPIDLVSGGTWFGINHHGILAAVMPREDIGKKQRIRNPRDVRESDHRHRSLGLLVTDCLAHTDAIAAMEAALDVTPALHHDFHLVLADRQRVLLVRQEYGHINWEQLGSGIRMFTEHGHGPWASRRAEAFKERLNFRLLAKRCPPTRVLEKWASFHDGGNAHGQSEAHVCRHDCADGHESTATTVVKLDAGHRLWTFQHRFGQPCRTAQAPYREILRLV